MNDDSENPSESEFWFGIFGNCCVFMTIVFGLFGSNGTKYPKGSLFDLYPTVNFIIVAIGSWRILSLYIKIDELHKKIKRLNAK